MLSPLLGKYYREVYVATTTVSRYFLTYQQDANSVHNEYLDKSVTNISAYSYMSWVAALHKYV